MDPSREFPVRKQAGTDIDRGRIARRHCEFDWIIGRTQTLQFTDFFYEDSGASFIDDLSDQPIGVFLRLLAPENGQRGAGPAGWQSAGKWEDVVETAEYGFILV